MDANAHRKLLVATTNPGKAREYRRLLEGIPIEITSLDQEHVTEEVEETGDTFEENARLKAATYASLSGLLTLADDSGLEVDALGGAPGVKSARYGGPQAASDEDRVRLLLGNLNGTGWQDRTCRFRCVIAIAWPSGQIKTVEGAVEGIVQYEPQGTNGFGYDPIFHVTSLGRTMAELPLKEKNGLSHRGQAARKAIALLKSEVKAGTSGR